MYVYVQFVRTNLYSLYSTIYSIYESVKSFKNNILLTSLLEFSIIKLVCQIQKRESNQRKAERVYRGLSGKALDSYLIKAEGGLPQYDVYIATLW